MSSPFPGMDPYLEGYLWPDLHHRLATAISRQLNPHLRPRYVARLEISIIHDDDPEVEIGVMYPDVDILSIKQAPRSVEPSPPAAGGTVTHAPSIVAPLTIQLPSSFRVRVPTIEIRGAKENELVSCIEILSPINKREPHLTRYREKRGRLHHANIHLLEIDLLRRGTRPFEHPNIPDVPYLAALTRAGRNVIEVWPIHLQDQLPELPVPLLTPDRDVILALSIALAEVYDEASYDLSLDYNEPPPPPKLSEAEQGWLETVLGQSYSTQVG